jgi:hypothetical protein
MASRYRYAILATLLALGAAVTYGAAPEMGDVIVTPPGSSPLVRFTIITPKGYVGFSVPKDWKVLSMNSKPPVAAIALQMPNPSDEGTPDSTNIAIDLIQPDSDQGKHALSKVGQAYEGDAQTSTHSGWDCYSQNAHQKKTLYTILDAKKSVADMIVWVRVAWPHLSRNAPDQDTIMKAAFNSLLDDVDGGLGQYASKPGDVLRRPEK